jgi:hypothetical protein
MRRLLETGPAHTPGIDEGEPDAPISRPAAALKQASPLECISPIPDDKVVWFVTAQAWRLRGHTQGPGQLGALLRAGRRR